MSLTDVQSGFWSCQPMILATGAYLQPYTAEFKSAVELVAVAVVWYSISCT